MILHQTSRTWQNSRPALLKDTTVRISKVSIVISTLIEHSSQYNSQSIPRVHNISKPLFLYYELLSTHNQYNYFCYGCMQQANDCYQDCTHRRLTYQTRTRLCSVGYTMRYLHHNIYPNRTFITIDNTLIEHT